jgi:muconolactone delta-isomerase
MKILAIEHDVPGLNAEDFQPHLAAEAARAWELHQSGLIRELYYCPERSEVVLVLECAGVEQANDILDSLPLVQAGLITFELLTLTAYPGFARLFTP